MVGSLPNLMISEISFLEGCIHTSNLQIWEIEYFCVGGYSIYRNPHIGTFKKNVVHETRGGSRISRMGPQPKGGECQPIIRPNVHKNCAKMKNIEPGVGGGASKSLLCRSVTGNYRWFHLRASWIPSKMNTDGLYSNERMKIFFGVHLYVSVGTLAQGNKTHDIVWVSYLSFSTNDPL